MRGNDIRLLNHLQRFSFTTLFNPRLLTTFRKFDSTIVRLQKKSCRNARHTLCRRGDHSQRDTPGSSEDFCPLARIQTAVNGEAAA